MDNKQTKKMPDLDKSTDLNYPPSKSGLRGIVPNPDLDKSTDLNYPQREQRLMS